MADLIARQSRTEYDGPAPESAAASLAHEEYTIDTPENITFGYAVAGIGSRFVGALIDTLLIIVLLILVNFILFAAIAAADGLPLGMAEWAEGVVIALYALLNFAVIWGYYMVFELIWHGQTPGKRSAGTRVIAIGGGPAGFLEVAIRNLVRLVDFMPFAYSVGLVTMLFNRQSRRLGDFAAGTLVVKQRGMIKLDELGGAAAATGLAHISAAQTADVPPYPGLRRLTGGDYQLICATMARYDAGAVSPDLLHRVARAVAARLQTAPPMVYDPGINRRFLADVADAYRIYGNR